MANMIDPQKVFEKMIERSRRHQQSLDFTYRNIGESALDGKEISDYQKARVAEDKARLNEIDEIVKIMQQIARDSD